VRRRATDVRAVHDAAPNECAVHEPTARSRHDSGPIVVAVDDESSSRTALDWAAAEASARQCTLRIVTAFAWSVRDYTSGPVPMVVGDAGGRDNAEAIASRAAVRAREVDPTLQVTTQVHEDSIGAAVLRAGRSGSLIVLGWRRNWSRMGSFVESPTWHIVRHADCPVSIVKLSEETARGPSAGRVVVGVGDATDPSAVLEFGFQAARRRGVGLTALRAVGPVRRNELGLAADGRTATELRAMEAKLQALRTTFPDVEVRRRLVTGPAISALVTESTGAALTVLGSQSRRVARCLRDQSVGHNVARFATSPVAIVKRADRMTEKSSR
jgi:nucleotide-binding universal stress UspA family protein